ncbi:ATP-binding cassette domain-containing protein [Curtobacterium sp. L1-20]|uniref:ATP-binding cassette domain-containing protein n=1 Tax=Curtobacterium sp. L1-20 TaxID=3138181 RepID=UPI003B51B6B4
MRSRPIDRSGRRAVDGADLDVPPGALTAIVGASGAGKSTFLDVLTGIEPIRSGAVRIGELVVNPASRRVRLRLRARTVATARQSEDLIDALTAAENIALAQRLARRPDRALLSATSRALHLDERLLATTTDKLSGGERRRVAVARAVASGSPVVCCDEPTAGLDAGTADAVRELLGAVAASGRTVLVVTHDPALARMSERLAMFRDGTISDVVENAAPLAVDRLMRGR